jgi:protein-L-isoaspartate O-methyltransferase
VTGGKALAGIALAALALAVHAQDGQAPRVGQEGKDVAWIPTPHALVEKMLDMAGVTAWDYVIDLGSGDGRNVIAAATRGARALGVEFDPQLAAISRRNAVAQGVADKARFVQGDMYQADISEATVLALFLAPENLRQLKPKFEKLKPGTRIVINGFKIEGWEVSQVARVEGGCGGWCTAYLHIVPPRAQ